MAKNADGWTFRAGQREEVKAKVDAAVYGRGDIASVVKALGGGAKGRSALAQQLAGTSDKKSRAYKSQMRNVQRWVSRERKLTKQKARVRQIGRKAQLSSMKAKGQANFRFAMSGKVSAKYRSFDVGFGDTSGLSGEQLNDFVRAMEEGREEDALAVAFGSYWEDGPDHAIEVDTLDNFDVR